MQTNSKKGKLSLKKVTIAVLTDITKSKRIAVATTDTLPTGTVSHTPTCIFG
jgi:hypothetical protein